MSELTREQIEELIERSKNDRSIIVGSEVRQLANMALRSLSSPSATTATRTPADYAIEHGEHLATAAMDFLIAVNNHDTAMSEDSDASEERKDVAREARSEHWKGLQSAIYEFRKRAERAKAAPAPAEPVDKGPWTVEVAGNGQWFIQSAKTDHDERLYVTGDFEEGAEEYANLIASKLNAAPTSPVVEAGATGWIAAHESGRIHHFSIADGWTVEVVTK